MSQDALKIIMFILGGVVGLAAMWVLLSARRAGAAASRDEAPDPPPRPWILLGIGEVSSISRTVIGLAGLGVAYHLIVHAAGWNQFRAPLPVAFGVALFAVLASLGTDALENRMIQKRTPRDDA